MGPQKRPGMGVTCTWVLAGGRAGLSGVTQTLDELTARMVHVVDGKMTGENRSTKKPSSLLFNRQTQRDCRSLSLPRRLADLPFLTG